jgi:hypothetical protein
MGYFIVEGIIFKGCFQEFVFSFLFFLLFFLYIFFLF